MPERTLPQRNLLGDNNRRKRALLAGSPREGIPYLSISQNVMHQALEHQRLEGNITYNLEDLSIPSRKYTVCHGKE